METTPDAQTAAFARAWRARTEAQDAYNTADAAMLDALTAATTAGATFPALADATGREATPEQLRGYLRRGTGTTARPAVAPRPTPPPPDGWITLRDVAQRAGLTRQSVRYHLDRGAAGPRGEEWDTFVRAGDGWDRGEGTRAPIFIRENAAAALIEKLKEG